MSNPFTTAYWGSEYSFFKSNFLPNTNSLFLYNKSYYHNPKCNVSQVKVSFLTLFGLYTAYTHRLFLFCQECNLQELKLAWTLWSICSSLSIFNCIVWTCLSENRRGKRKPLESHVYMNVFKMFASGQCLKATERTGLRVLAGVWPSLLPLTFRASSCCSAGWAQRYGEVSSSVIECPQFPINTGSGHPCCSSHPIQSVSAGGSLCLVRGSIGSDNKQEWGIFSVSNKSCHYWRWYWV